MRNLALVVIASFAFASAAGAHPGHGEAAGAFSLAHYLTAPFHVFSAFMILFVVVAVAHVYRRRRSATSLDALAAPQPAEARSLTRR